MTLFSHVDQFHTPEICQLHLVPPPLNKVRFFYIKHTFMLTLGNRGGVILLA